MRIAIIEDDEITRLELSKLLNTQGYETVLLTDFEHLTEELKQYSAELVLLDSKRQILMRSDTKSLQPFASWSNSL